MEDNDPATASKPKRGRPRKDAAEKAARRAEIMNAAVHLFSQYSYREITMSDIARAAGLNQSSLYYWFKDKEDLLHAILQESEVSLQLALTVSSYSGKSLLRLYSIVYSDALMMCSFPSDYYELEAAALAYPERLGPFFETYRSLRGAIGRVIEQGVEEGVFPAGTDSGLATIAVLSLTEGLQHQYHQSSAVEQDAEVGIWGDLVLQPSEALARLAATSAVAAVTKSRVDADSLHAEAVACGWIISGGESPARVGAAQP